MRGAHSKFMFVRGGRGTIHRLHVFPVMSKRFLIHLLVGALAAVVVATDRASWNHGPPADVSGSFNVTIAGFWNGTGSATVSGNTVSISGTVTDDNGNSGPVVIGPLKLSKCQFRGVGSIMGYVMMVQGRVDAPDPPPQSDNNQDGDDQQNHHGRNYPQNSGPVVTNARLGATFSALGHHGRIAGSRQ